MDTKEISFSCNGKDMGVAFIIGKGKKGKQTASNSNKFYPAFSLNEGEKMRINTGSSEFRYPPKGEFRPTHEAMAAKQDPTAVSTLILQEAELEEDTMPEDPLPTVPEGKKRSLPLIPNQALNPNPVKKTKTMLEKEAQRAEKKETEKEASKKEAEIPVEVPEPLKLGKYKSVKALQDLGLDRLKSALKALGMKCGGTLEQRAERLWSVRGISTDKIDPKLLAKKKQSTEKHRNRKPNEV